jgi:magnesium transporter
VAPLETDDDLAHPRVSAADLRDAWPVLDAEARVEGFRHLSSAEAEEYFLELSAHDRAQLVGSLPDAEQRWWLRALPPDDLADLLQETPDEERARLVEHLDEATRRETNVLLAYSEDEAGGLMNPRYARLRPEMTVDEAIGYLRRQTRERVESIYYAYVQDPESRLLGVVSFRQLMMARGETRVRDVMATDLVTVHDELDQEAVGRLFAQHDLLAIPVVDAQGRMQGVVTADDIVDVVREEATEDIHKIGGTAALEAPYLQVRFREMFQKRAPWLVVLFVSGTLTVGAIRVYQDTLDQVKLLAFFLPLIISSGGNCGSQASTLVIRALALGELRLRDWWRVFLREVITGVALGAMLGVLGLFIVVGWHHLAGDGTELALQEHFLLLSVAIGLSVLGVATWGTMVGALLPFALKRLGLDPASASAPLVATLSDVTGLVIYFSVAIAVLSGTLL